MFMNIRMVLSSFKCGNGLSTTSFPRNVQKQLPAFLKLPLQYQIPIPLYNIPDPAIVLIVERQHKMPSGPSPNPKRYIAAYP
jgi:hypothetical protein